MRRGKAASEREIRVRTTVVHGRPAVVVPFIGTLWLQRGAAYQRRRRLAAAAFGGVSVTATALSALFIAGLARPATAAAFAAATGYGLLVVVGVVVGRRWLVRTPARSRWASDGISGMLGVLLFVFVPVLAGFGLAVLPAMFGRQFPGEQRARELSDLLADPEPAHDQAPRPSPSDTG
jgi:hypothetical protein